MTGKASPFHSQGGPVTRVRVPPSPLARRIEGGAPLRRSLRWRVGRARLNNGDDIKQPNDLDAGLRFNNKF